MYDNDFSCISKVNYVWSDKVQVLMMIVEYKYLIYYSTWNEKVTMCDNMKVKGWQKSNSLNDIQSNTPASPSIKNLSIKGKSKQINW